MKIFVASWFYPPVTTSEAIVTYKLLSNSKNEYYLCSASSKQWTYNKETILESKNVKQYIIDTDDFDEYIDKTVEKYLELSKKIKFDAIMTRTMPPEPQEVGLRIKKIDKNIPWIVSLADPIANNPYETYGLVYSRHRLVRNSYLYAPRFCLNYVCPLSRNKYTRKLRDLNKLERKIVEKCDVVIVPTEEQGRHIMYKEKEYEKKCLVVPHSYDKKLYKRAEMPKNDKFVFSFIGHSDGLRSVEPFVRALKIIKDINPDFLSKIRVRFVGNIPMHIKNMVYVFFLNDIISIEEPCDYFESLKIMEASDCLIHIDANFPYVSNGSIFFAAKIADYLGAEKPILGITNPESPAGKIIRSANGICANPDPVELANKIISIVENTPKPDLEAAKKYDVENVAKEYDEELERRIANER